MGPLAVGHILLGLIGSSSWAAGLMQPCSWLRIIEPGHCPALNGSLLIGTTWHLIGFYAFGMYIHNDTLLALGRQSDQFGDTGIPFRPVIGLLGQALLGTVSGGHLDWTCGSSRQTSNPGRNAALRSL